MNIVQLITSLWIGIVMTGIQTISATNDTCNSNIPNIRLCSTGICPASFHVCNSFDAELITHAVKENNFESIDDIYHTDINNNGGNCIETPDEIATTISNMSAHAYDDTCSYDNKVIRNGEGILLDKCIFCTCNKKQSICINTCKYSTYLNRIHDYKEVAHNLLNIPEIQQEKRVRCKDRKYYDNVACCRNNNCKMPHCISCMSYGVREECNICEKGHYFYKNHRSKCYTMAEIELVCDNSYKLDETTHQFECISCIHGTFQTIGSTRRCVCDGNYFGAECSKNYDKVYCMNNGVYNKMTRRCVCNEGYSGNSCQEYTSLNCNHGIYNVNMEECVCRKGYSGAFCENKVACKYGLIVKDVCLCNDGFSGEDCSVFRQETELQKKHKQHHLQSFYESPCKFGVYNNKTTTCDCFNGYEGNDCNRPLCRHGSYNTLLDICECDEHYYGSKCDRSCLKQCNYNGNMCNYDKTCVCENGWYGETCDKILLEDASIRFGSSIEIDLKKGTDVEDTTTAEVVPCYSTSCIPFMIKRLRMTNVTSQRRLRNSDANSQTIDIRFPPSYINKTNNEAIYIYPNNDYNLSYYGGVEHIEINDTTYTSYYFSVEPLRANDSVRHSVMIDNDVLFNITDPSQTTNETLTDENNDDGRNEVNYNETSALSDDYTDDDMIRNDVIRDNATTNNTTYENTTEVVSDDTIEQHSAALDTTSGTEASTDETYRTPIIIGGVVAISFVITITILLLQKRNNARKEKRSQQLRKKNLVKNKTKDVVFTMNSMYFNNTSKHGGHSNV
jgi:hypothetical protein